MTDDDVSPEELERLRELAADLEAMAHLRKYSKLQFFIPYPKQLEHIQGGKTNSERLLMAGNQQGKSEVGAAELAYHLTGDYPEDWKGWKVNHPIQAWAAAPTALVMRDVGQTKLLGTPDVLEDFGSGFIPRDRIIGKPTMARTISNAVDTVVIEHRTGGVMDGASTLKFKSYEQGQQKFQGPTLDFIWLDEQPPMDIYVECLARLTATNGRVAVTFTNTQAEQDVIERFKEGVPGRSIVRMSIEDALHIPAEERQNIINKYSKADRDARIWGFPMLGSGRIFQTTRELISEARIEEVPGYWHKIWGIDFGIDHPFAAALLLWDKDNDILHVHHTIRMSDATILQHATAIRAIANAVPVAWPQDGTQRDRGSLKPLATLYREHDLRMIATHATFEDGSVSTEAGVAEMETRFGEGRLKVASHLSDFWDEFGSYHRDKGLIVKKKDDILSAVRVGVMAKRYAQMVPLGSGKRRKPATGIAQGVDKQFWGIDD